MFVKVSFITNSSTEVFCAYGMVIADEKIFENSEIMKFIYLYSIAFRVRIEGEGYLIKFKGFSEFCKDYELSEMALHNYCNTLGFDCIVSGGMSSVFIGRSPWNMREDETFGEFKKKTAELFLHTPFEGTLECHSTEVNTG